MARFITRRLGFMLLTMFMVSIVIFLITEVAPGDVARRTLGQFASQESVDLLRDQMGLDQPLYVRYLDWLIGNDWRLRRLVGMPLEQTRLREQDDPTWYAEAPDGTLKQWKMREEGLAELTFTPDGARSEEPFSDWLVDERGEGYFYGVDTANHVVLWKAESEERDAEAAAAGRVMTEASGEDYFPLSRGLLRGDPGISYRTRRPVGPTLVRRLRNSLTLALVAFLFIMPIALALGIVAGLNEGRPSDRGISVASLVTTSIPEFVTGVLLILVFSFWLQILPGATVYTSDVAPWQEPEKLILPVLTLTLVEVGYVTRMTKASMIEVTNAPYIRTAYLKGLPKWRVVIRHSIRNALMAPITVIMLHVNWLIGGIVVVESVFGYPGLGMYLLDSALFKDVNAIEAGAMVMVALAVSTQLVADIIYTFLNPRIRYT